MSDPVLREGLEGAEAVRPDLMLFVVAVLGGVTAYLYMHEARVRQLFATAVICGIMLAYAVLVSRIPRVRVRLDQAGDNAYYMGLLFTLTSMAIALHEFAGGGGTEQIVSNFGIALASTICGIFLRVCLHQMRVDPVDVENMTRIELAEATTRVRAILGTLTADVTLFHREMHQRLNDAVHDFTGTYRKTTERYSEELNHAASRVLTVVEAHQMSALDRGTALMKHAEATAASAAAAAERLGTIKPPSADFSRSLEHTASRLAALVAPIETLQTVLEKTAASAQGTLQRILATDQEDRNQRAQLLKDIAAAATQLQSALAKTGATLEQDRSLLSQLTADARQASAEAVRAGEAANEVLLTLTAVTRGLTQVVRGAPPAQTP
jgi:hypothetical protein